MMSTNLKTNRNPLYHNANRRPSGAAVLRTTFEELPSVFYLLAHLVEEACCTFLPTEPEGEAKGKRECNDQAREERLEVLGADTKLGKRHNDGEDPDGPACDGSCKSRGSDTCGARGATDDTLCHLGDNRSDEQYQDRHNYLRHVREHDLLEEEGYLGKAQDLERREQKDDDDKPLHQPSDKLTRIKREARAVDDVLNPGGLQSMVNLYGFDCLRNHTP